LKAVYDQSSIPVLENELRKQREIGVNAAWFRRKGHYKSHMKHGKESE
jgi:hypothetical protein